MVLRLMSSLAIAVSLTVSSASAVEIGVKVLGNDGGNDQSPAGHAVFMGKESLRWESNSVEKSSYPGLAMSEEGDQSINHQSVIIPTERKTLPIKQNHINESGAREDAERQSLIRAVGEIYNKRYAQNVAKITPQNLLVPSKREISKLQGDVEEGFRERALMQMKYSTGISRLNWRSAGSIRISDISMKRWIASVTASGAASIRLLLSRLDMPASSRICIYGSKDKLITDEYGGGGELVFGKRTGIFDARAIQGRSGLL